MKIVFFVTILFLSFCVFADAQDGFLKKYIEENDFLKSRQSDIKFDADGNLLPPNPTAEKIIGNAIKLLNNKNLFGGKVSFIKDCSGTVLLINFLSGIDLRKSYAGYDGNGVKRINEIAKKDLLYGGKIPIPGDVIFFDNTYDKNRNRKWDDSLTHVALVLSVDKNGTINYIHYDYSVGVTEGKMNLFAVDKRQLEEGGDLVNSKMRMREDEYLNPSQTLASQLFREFGRVY